MGIRHVRAGSPQEDSSSTGTYSVLATIETLTLKNTGLAIALSTLIDKYTKERDRSARYLNDDPPEK
jgi:hypothetical protein